MDMVQLPISVLKRDRYTTWHFEQIPWVRGGRMLLLIVRLLTISLIRAVVLYSLLPYPQQISGAALGALHIIDSDPSVLERLQDNVGYMSDRLNSMGIYATADTPIFPILIGKNEDTLVVSNYLYEAGIIGTAIRPPTVPVGESRIRLTVTAAHSKAQIDYVCDTLYKAIKELS